jgi:hypothetical protein
MYLPLIIKRKVTLYSRNMDSLDTYIPVSDQHLKNVPILKISMSKLYICEKIIIKLLNYVSLRFTCSVPSVTVVE